MHYAPLEVKKGQEEKLFSAVMGYKLVEWYKHTRRVYVHENYTAKDLRDRCLFFCTEEIKSTYDVYVKSRVGYETLIKENEEFGYHLKECQLISFKPKSSSWDGLPAIVRMPVYFDDGFAAGSMNDCSSLEFYWDIENCPIPNSASGTMILDRLLQLLGGPRLKDIKLYVVCGKSGYTVPVQLLRSYLNLDVITLDNVSKDAADQKISDLLSSNSDARKSGTIITVITGDKDFCKVLYDLVYVKGFFTVLIHKPNINEDLRLWPMLTFTIDDLCRNFDCVDNVHSTHEQRGKKCQEITDGSDISGSKEITDGRNEVSGDDSKTVLSDNFICPGPIDASKQLTIFATATNNCVLLQVQETTNVIREGDRDVNSESFHQERCNPVNVKLKKGLVKDNETSCLLSVADACSGYPAQNCVNSSCTIKFLKKEEEIRIYPWDTVEILREQLTFALSNEEHLDFNTDLISCEIDDKKIIDKCHSIMPNGEGNVKKRVMFKFESHLMTKIQTYMSIDCPLIDTPFLETRSDKAVILLDMKNCMVPKGKNGLHILMRVFHRFCSGCKIQEILAYHDDTQVPAVGEAFCSMVQLIACTDISQKIKDKIFKLQKDDGIHKLVIITGDKQIADYVSSLQETCSKTFLLIPNRYLNDFLKRPDEWTFDHLTCELPEDLHKSVDLKRKVVIDVKTKAENQILSKVEDKALTRELQNNIFLRNGYARHPYREAFFQTRTTAKDFKDVMDGSVISGSEVKAYLADEIEQDKKRNDSSVADYKANMNVLLKADIPLLTKSLSQETHEEDEKLDPTIDDRQEQCDLAKLCSLNSQGLSEVRRQTSEIVACSRWK